MDAEFIEYKAEAKATMNALEKKIDDGIGRLFASIKAMKEESDAKFEELRQLILGTAPSQSTNVDHVPQITKVPAKTAPYVPPIRRRYDDLGFELHNLESSTAIGKNLRPKSWDVEGSNKLEPGTTNDMNGGAGTYVGWWGFDLRAFEGLNCDLGKGEERITWNPGINHHPSERKGNYGLNSSIESVIKSNHVFQHFRPNDDQHERRGVQRRIWDPGITWLKILKEHLEDKVKRLGSDLFYKNRIIINRGLGIVFGGSCGVCHSDLHVIKGELPFPSPCVLGHEITGEVVEHGPLTDTKTIERLPVGARVVGAFIMPCGNCFFCTKGQDDLCEAFFAYNRAKGTLYDGETRLFLRGSSKSACISNIAFLLIRGDELAWPGGLGKPVYMYSMGGLAEYSVVPAHGLAILPQTLPYSESAVIGCAVFTAYGAMAHAAQVRPGDAVAVIGVGGVGSSCLQIARAFGASEIIAVDIQDEKLEKAKLLGATHVVNARTEDAVAKIMDITGGMGVDTCVEALGNPKTFSQCVQSVRAGGKAVMIGLTLSGAKGVIDINHLVRRQIKVMGSYGGRARHDLPKLVKLAESGIFNLDAAVSRKCKFEEAGAAYDDLNKGNIIGRAVVEIM
ncbi:alcohol dehydrogenase 1B [Tanacetum coccineum]